MATRIKKSFLYACLVLLAAVCLFPFLLMMVNATRSGIEIMTSFTIIPGTSLSDNWDRVISNLDIFRGMANSLFISVSCTVLTAYFSALTAYGFAFYRFRGSRAIFSMILAMMMVPAQLGLLGFFDLANTLGMVDTYYPLIIPAIASPGTVFFLRQYAISVIPKSILEASRIDGASEIATFHRIGMRMMLPGIATMSIGVFIGSWNAYLVPLMLLNTPENFTLPVMVASLNSLQDISLNQGAIYLTVAMATIPIIIAFIFFSRYIISSISAGSVKE